MMSVNDNIPYKSFCWVIGTTSFRTAKLNLKIEQQLTLLDAFKQKFDNWQWESNSNIQTAYYDWLLENDFVQGNAARKAKDAREKTSGLFDIGLINKNRELTIAGKALLSVTKQETLRSDNFFNLEQDSFIYFKQLVKTNLTVGDNIVRPYLVLAKFLTELGYLTYREFKYLLPLATDTEKADALINNIKLLRQNTLELDEIIYQTLMQMDNYQSAQTLLLQNDVNQNLICTVGMNRKSRVYDNVYYPLYQQLKQVFLDGSDDIVALFEAVNAVKQKIYWKNLLFKTRYLGQIKRKKRAALADNIPFFQCVTENELKSLFFRYLHTFKAKATLSDYFDLNRRYFSLTDTLIFQDEKVKFDIFPKYFFQINIDEIYKNAFTHHAKLTEDIGLNEVFDGVDINIQAIYQYINKQLNSNISSPEQAARFIKNERYHRFNKLLDEKFPPEILLSLLTHFEQRNDRKIEELVTEEADIPTIFEYVLAIIWYRISEKKGDILNDMKLSLDANLLPKTHAAGGSADIVYHYESCTDYPKHTLLIEATLADNSNQRRMELEPVSRHLGDYRLQSNNDKDYAIFISTFLHKNVVSDFRYRKAIPYFGQKDASINGMKIISLDTETLSALISNQSTYSQLYPLFERYHQSDLPMPQWFDELKAETLKLNG